MHLFCSRLHISHSRSSKIVDFGTNRKSGFDFLLVINSNFLVNFLKCYTFENVASILAVVLLC